MNKLKIIMLLLMILSGSLCIGCIENSTVDAKSTTNAESVEDYDITAANNAFTFDMYRKVTNTEENNIFFSPYSIFSAMAICYEGSQGITKEQIANVFYFPLDKTILKVSLGEIVDDLNTETDDYELKNANALWIQKDFAVKKQYISNVENYYSGNVENLDFVEEPEESKNTINNWVEEQTNDKIKDLIPDGAINKKTRLIITNAIYFNGKWQNEFDKEATKKDDFYPSGDEELLVDMMYTKQYFSYGENSKAKIIELPYKGDNLCMYVVLPDKNDINDFETDFSVGDYEKLKSDMDSEYEVKTWIPKFKFETKIELSSSLTEMGIVDAFDNDKANFSEISDEQISERLKISKVIHQAFVDVQEEGTEAAAATAVIMETCESVEEPKPVPIREFRADHPFMFFIEDKNTGCILFMGKVGSPEYE